MGGWARYSCSSRTTSSNSMEKNPKSSSRWRSRSSVQNTGSPSNRGKQAQTISPLGSISAASAPLPTSARSSDVTRAAGSTERDPQDHEHYDQHHGQRGVPAARRGRALRPGTPEREIADPLRIGRRS